MVCLFIFYEQVGSECDGTRSAGAGGYIYRFDCLDAARLLESFSVVDVYRARMCSEVDSTRRSQCISRGPLVRRSIR